MGSKVRGILKMNITYKNYECMQKILKNRIKFESDILKAAKADSKLWCGDHSWKKYKDCYNVIIDKNYEEENKVFSTLEVRYTDKDDFMIFHIDLLGWK